MRRSLLFLLAAAVAIAVAACGSAAPSWTFASPGSAVSAGPAATVPPAAAASAASEPVDGDDGDDGTDPTAVTANLSPSTRAVQIYAEQPSILPGEPLTIHASGHASSYTLTVAREVATGLVTVATRRHLRLHNYASLVRTDRSTWTVRANWPASVRISTSGWAPGVYELHARDSSGGRSDGLFVIRSPKVDPNGFLFVVPVTDYQAYNTWGSRDFYTTPQATLVSFDRPFAQNGGLSYWPVYDRAILRWLLSKHYPVSYTTDLDLNAAPPDATPRVLVLGEHTEYVAAPMMNWVDQHVNVAGDMNVALFGANTFYWQVRLFPDPRGGSRPPEVYCSKSASDPRATTPDQTTNRWRDEPVDRPEGRIFGSQYVGIAAGGHTHGDMVVASTAPAWLLAGTGYQTGTVLKGLIFGEVDGTRGGADTVTALVGTTRYLTVPGQPVITATTTVRENSVGARVFDAGTFAWGKGISGEWKFGVSTSSFRQLTANILGWLSAPRP